MREAMDIRFNCSTCGKHLVVEEAGAGRLIVCPDCGSEVSVPSPPAKPGLGIKRKAQRQAKPCLHCHHPMEADAAFCTHCGKQTDGAVTGKAPRPAGYLKPVAAVLFILVAMAVAYIQLRSSQEPSPTIEPQVQAVEADPLADIKAKADSGDLEAMLQLSEKFASNHEPWQAFHYLLKAADAGHDESVSLVAMALMGVWNPETNVVTVREWLTDEANSGSPEAQFQMGFMSYMDGPKADMTKAVEWFRKASDAGHQEAMFTMAMFHKQGVNVATNLQESARLLGLIDSKKLPLASETLGVMTILGQGVPVDVAKGISLIETAANNGRVESANLLANIYLAGEVVARDEAKARTWFEQAGQLGDYASMAKAGLMYLDSDDYEVKRKGYPLIFTALPKDQDAAYGEVMAYAMDKTIAKLHAANPPLKTNESIRIRKAIGNVVVGTVQSVSDDSITIQGEKGIELIPYRAMDTQSRMRCDPSYREIMAMSYGMEFAYELVKGYVPKQQGLPDISRDKIREMAEQGNREAQTLLGLALSNNKDTKAEGLEWLKKSAEAGSPLGQYSYGMALMSVNTKDAFPWIVMAAEQGHVDAALTAGQMLMVGEGCDRDEDAGMELIRFAAGQFHSEAVMLLGKLLYGDGKAKDASEAFAWFRLEGIQGNPEAQYWIGRLYYEGKAVPQNLDKAFQWLSSSASQGYAPAINLIEADAAQKQSMAQAKLEYEAYYREELERHGRRVEDIRRNPKYDVITVTGKMPSSFATGRSERTERSRWMAYRKEVKPSASYAQYKADTQVRRTRTSGRPGGSSSWSAITGNVMDQFRRGTLQGGYIPYTPLGGHGASSWDSYGIDGTMRDGWLEAVQAGMMGYGDLDGIVPPPGTTIRILND